MPVSDLQDFLRIGLTVVSELWHATAKNWVTAVAAADIDSDGDIEILTGSRDGRVRVLTYNGDLRWERVIGNKVWVGTLAAFPDSSAMPARILVGSRDGLVFALDKDGKTISLDGKLYSFDRAGVSVEPERERAAFWLKSAQVIRQVLITPATSTTPAMILAASEDRSVYALDAESGNPLWTFHTQGPVRAICAGDVNGDGELEILAGSGDRSLYLLNSKGECLQQLPFERQQIYTLLTADVDGDGQVEILVGTDAKDLLALDADLSLKWSRHFPNRLLCLLVADVDGDGDAEIIAGCEDKHLYILDQQGDILWRHHLGAAAFSLYARDVDHDGQIEVLVGSEHNQVHAFRIHLVRQLPNKIRRQYQKLGKPSLDSLSSLLPAERDLLQDILEEEQKQRPISRTATLEHARQLCEEGETLSALLELLRLEQQKVQPRWGKDIPGHVRALYLGDISGDPKLEIVMGTADGSVLAFNTIGRELWKLPLGGQILALQTGYLDQGRWQEIVACSSDHQIYVISGIGKKKIKRQEFIDQWMSSFYLLAPDRRNAPTVIVATEEGKLSFYSDDLSAPLQTIPTPQGIKIVYAYDATRVPHPPGEQVPEVIAGGLENQVYAYTRQGRRLWDYPTQDRVLAIAIKDLDGDGRVEIIIGSEDRNVHVLTNDGRLKWRYFLEHRVIAVDACDLNGDGHLEVLAGCGDGRLYVLSAQGEPLWQYQTNDRIRVVRAEDIDVDGYVEIALGSEDRLELLRVIDQNEVSERLDQCWQQLVQERPAHEVIDFLLTHASPLVRAFALRRFAEQPVFTADDFARLEDFVREDALPIRQALCYAVMRHYSADPVPGYELLTQLSVAQERKARLAFVEQLSVLMPHHWDLGMDFLQRFLRNRDRFVRRAVIRQIYQLLPTAPKQSIDAFFQLLLQGLNDDDSVWIHQEAARSLALLLDRHEKLLVGYLYNLITNGVSSAALRSIADYVLDPRVRQLFYAIDRQLFGLNETNAADLVEQALSAWAALRMLPYGQDAWLLANELSYLLSLQSIEDIAHYQCRLHLNQFTTPDNAYAPVALLVFDHLSTITNLLSIYLHHNTIQDQLNCLLEAITSIDAIQAYVDRQYTGTASSDALSRLPDRMLFEIILKRWHAIMMAKYRELSGRPDLKLTLLTPYPRREEEVGIMLLLSNVGTGAANNVKLTLLNNDDFTVIGSHSHEARTLFPQEEIRPEFVIQPRSLHSSRLDLSFEIAYYDDFNDGQLSHSTNGANGATRSAINYRKHDYALELTAPPQQFRFISNPYSTGTPTPNMFYGRSQDIAYLKDNLTRPEAKSVIVLYGQRRSGKTTLLRYLVDSAVLGEHLPVMIDMQAEYNVTINTLLLHIASYIYRAAQKRDIQLPRPNRSEFTADPTFAFNLFLDDVEALLGSRKIILLIDEFEVLETQVKKKNLEEEIFAYLRSLIQHRQHINFVFSGTHQIRQLTTGYWSVFFNIADHHRLWHLDPGDAEALITRPVAEYLEYEPHAVQKICRLTGNQPYLIHLVCRSLVDLCNKKEKSYVTIHDVNIVQQSVMQTGQFHFDWIWDQITPEEQSVLAAIAEARKEEERLISLSEIADLYRDYHIPFKRESVLVAIKTLVEFDVVALVADDTQSSPESNRYRIAVGLIGKWLRKEKPLGQFNRTLP